jgi:hypothetical protein
MASNAAFTQALQDVTKRFATPQALVDSDEFDREQKIKLLQQWEQDLRLEMVASEENMPGQMPGQSQGGAAETFRKVREGLKSLGAAEKDKPAAATKTGS